MCDILLYYGLRNMRMGRLAFFAFVFFHVQLMQAQDIPNDTTDVIEKIVMEKDTMVGYPADLQQKWSLPQEKPIDSILFGQQNTRFRKELYHLLIRDNSRKLANQKTPTDNSDLAAKDGKIIRRIEFKRIDIFAPSVIDTFYVSTSRLESTLNAMHNDTRLKILEKHLLLHTDDPLDVFLVAENERILRDLPFIMDARFLAKSIPGSPDSVDLLLLTQDLFPVGFQADISKSNIGSANIWNQNLLGYGHQSMVTLFWNGDNIPRVGYGLSYGIASLAGSFTAARLEYINRWDLNSLVVDVSRDFRTSSFRYAGGAVLENTTARKEIDLLDTTLLYVGLKYTNTDLWAGRMIKLRNHSSEMSSGIFLTGRLNLYKNHDGPKTSEKYLYPYQDKTLLLFSACFSRRGFKKDNLIYSFGRTEDVPYGYHLELTSGVEHGQYETRFYLSASASMGKYFTRAGYFYGQAKFGTFYNDGISEQGTLQLRLQYITRVYRYNHFQYRNFVSLNYMDGINRFEGEFASLENKGGITGLTSNSMRGNDKMVLNLESIIFSPFVFLGFHFAFFGSIDLGLISPKSALFSDSRVYSGIRVGVRIRNDQLVFNTFEINFALYPGMPADGQGEYVTAGSLARLRFNDFFPYKPMIVNYQ